MFTCTAANGNIQHDLNEPETCATSGRSVMTSLARRVAFILFQENLPSHPRKWIPFPFFTRNARNVFKTLLHRNLTTTLTLLHIRNNRRQKCEEMARLAAHASTTAINRDMCCKLWQTLKQIKLRHSSGNIYCV